MTRLDSSTMLGFQMEDRAGRIDRIMSQQNTKHCALGNRRGANLNEG